jgi:hypothetical protein
VSSTSVNGKFITRIRGQVAQEREPCRNGLNHAFGQLCPHFLYNFANRHRFHAAEVQRTFSQEAWAAFDMVPDNGMPISHRPGQCGFG